MCAPNSSGRTDHQREQILMQRLADKFNVRGGKRTFIPQAFRYVALRPVNHGSELSATNPMASHGKANFVTYGDGKQAGLRLRSTGHVRHAIAPIR